MKRYINILSLMMISGMILLSSCDEVDPPYLKSGGGFVDTNEVVQKILLEEFTGMKCGNCPAAHREAKRLSDYYPGRIILVGLHAKFYAKPDPSHPLDLRCDESEELETKYGALQAGFPKGMLNRMELNGNVLQDPGNWDTEIPAILNQEPPMSIELTPSYDEATHEISVDVDIEYFKAGETTHNLCVFILEDNIVGFQTDDEATPSEIEDYVHRHVLRGSMNGTWGEAVSTTAPTTGEMINKTVKFVIPEENRPGGEKEWNVDNLILVAFVHNYDGNSVVLQAEEAHLIEE